MSVSVTVVLVLFLLLSAVSNSRGEERTDPIFLDFRFNHKLNLPKSTIMQSTLVKDRKGCLTSCFNARWCKSGNYKTTPESNGFYVCEVLSSDEFNYNKILPTKDEAYQHFRIKTPCELFQNKKCLNGGECVLKDQKHQCKCAPGFKGEKCEQVPFQVENCNGYVITNETEILLDGSGDLDWTTKMCRAVIVSISSPSVSYRIDVDIFSYRTPPSSNIMHPGIGFNVQDMSNMDAIYFRLHLACKYALQVLKVQRGVRSKMSAPCFLPSPAPAYAWFHVTAKVTASSIKVFVDDVHATTFTPFFPLTKRGAVMVFNGYENSVKFRNIRIVTAVN